MTRTLFSARVQLTLMLASMTLIFLVLASAGCSKLVGESDVGHVVSMGTGYGLFNGINYLVVSVQPSNLAIANKIYNVDLNVDLYEKGKFRSTSTVSWNQPEINAGNSQDVNFPITYDENDAYNQKCFDLNIDCIMKGSINCDECTKFLESIFSVKINAPAPTPTPTPTPKPTSVVNNIRVQILSATLEGIKLPDGSTVTVVRVRVTLTNESATSQTYSLTIKNGETGGGATLNHRTLESGQQINIEQKVHYAMDEKIQVYLNDVFVGEVTPTAS